MASIFVDKDNQEIITLSKKEAVDVLALLTGLLGQETVPGNMAGAAPEIKIMDRGLVIKRLFLLINHAEP